MSENETCIKLIIVKIIKLRIEVRLRLIIIKLQAIINQLQEEVLN